MSYATDRNDEQLAQLDAEISRFINRFKQNPSTGPRKTVILFPGGMGSRLERASTPHGVTPYFYSTVWLDCSILSGAALLLKMNGDEDEARHFVVADGGVSFSLMNLRPYQGFLEWCTDNGFDWFVFGWDWRRRPQAAATFFLNTFVRKFRRRVQAACGADPFDDVTLIGHSFGGMVVKLILNHGGATVDQIARAITVASPFYGHAGHVHRYFEGDPDLDSASFLYNKRNLVQLISSLWGPYTLLYLDEATYLRDRTALAQDAAFPLTRYPVRDKATDAVADPYDPATLNGQVRYPRDWGFLRNELSNARNTYRQVAQPLSAVTNEKFYNIRGVQKRRGGIVFETVHEQTWKWIDPDFDPKTDASPVKDRTMCPGDGVIPAWSARLASTLPENVRTVTGDVDRDDFEHMDLMLNEGIQEQIFEIMQQPAGTAMAMKTRGSVPQPRATREELTAFLQGLEAAQMGLSEDVDALDVATRAYLAKFSLVDLQRLMGRAYVDLPKSASQKRGKPPTTRSGEPLDEEGASPASTGKTPGAKRTPRKGKPK